MVHVQVFETSFKEDMEEAEAVEVVKEAILAGVFNDLGSGSNVDVTVIRAGGETVRQVKWSLFVFVLGCCSGRKGGTSPVMLASVLCTPFGPLPRYILLM